MRIKNYIHFALAAAVCICTGCGSEKTLIEKPNQTAEPPADTEEAKKPQEATAAKDPEKENTEETAVGEAKPSSPAGNSHKITTGREARSYMDSCIWEFDRTDLLRYEEDYTGTDFAFIAEVSQVMDDNALVVFDDANDDGIFADGQYYVFDNRSFDTTRILEGDKIVVYGQYAGIGKFTRAIGNSNTSLPEFHMYVCDVEGVELTPDKKTAESMDYLQYADVVADTEDGVYTLYDIDKDGIKELITSEGTSVTDFNNTVYTMDVYGQVSMIGEFYGLVSFYEAEEGLYSVNECIGYESADLIMKNDQQLTVINIISGEEAANYKNDSPVLMTETKDLSLLEMKISSRTE